MTKIYIICNMEEYDFNIFYHFGERSEGRDKHDSSISRASVQRQYNNTTKKEIEKANRSKLNRKLNKGKQRC